MSDVRSGMVIAGKYRLEAALARGGMGSVWRGRHLMLDTPVAIKFIGAEVFALQEARRRFEREAKAAAMLQSPHVVRIHDYGVEGNLPYLVMELLQGEDLGACLKRRERLTPDETASIVFQVARALRRAAEAGIVHRDLKPSNVYLIRDEDEDLVKVLDFGVAKAPRGLRADDESTRNGAIIGSPRYMSPEQARGSPLVDPRSDLWSLAVIAYRAVTGELPFQSLDMTDLIVKICSEDPTPPTRIDPTLGPEMDAFFGRALQREPAARFQTARELASAFASAAGLPPPSVSSRRLMVRHPSGTLSLSDVLSVSPPAPATAVASSQPAPRSEIVPAAPAAPSVPLLPSESEPRSAASGAAEAASPPCESTRISGPPHAPAAPSDATQPSGRVAPKALPKGTPTPYPSGIESPAARTARPPRPVGLRRVVLGTGAATVVLVGLLAIAPWRGGPRSVPAVSAAPDTAAAPPAIDPGVEPVAPPARAATAPEPVVTPTRPAVPAPDTTSPAPAAASALPPRPLPASLPASRTGSRKRHAILGI